MTASGAGAVSGLLLSRFIDADKRTVEKVSGNIVQGVTLKNVRLNSIRQLPENSELLIQQLYWSAGGFSSRDISLNINNARLDLPASDPIILFAALKNGRLEANVFSPSVTVHEVLGYLNNNGLRHLRGQVDDADFYIEGGIDKFVTRGKFKVVQLSRPAFHVLDVPGEFSIEWVKKGRRYVPKGVIKFFSGKLNVKRIKLDLEESHIIFDSDIKDPRLDIRAATAIEDVKISITLRGSRLHPDLRLSSLPPLPEEQLALMLVTGKRWKGLETSLRNKKVSPELSKDVFDFLFSSGEAGKITRKLGIRDVNIQLRGDKKTVGGMIGVTKNVGVGYQVTETKSGETADVEHRVQGEVNLNKNLSVTVDKELPKRDAKDQTEEKAKTDDKIQLKYKMKF